MSARDTLVTTLTNLLAVSTRGRMDTHRAKAEALVDDALKEHAHGLAEKIRESPGWCHGEWMDSRDRNHAANIIDPEVTA